MKKGDLTRLNKDTGLLASDNGQGLWFRKVCGGVVFIAVDDILILTKRGSTRHRDSKVYSPRVKKECYTQTSFLEKASK